MNSLPPRALAMLVALTVIWGCNWPLFPLAMHELSVWTFRAVSLSGGGLLLLLVARLRGIPLGVPRAHWGMLLAAAVCYLAVWNVASGFSAITIPSGQSAVLGFTMPLWVAVLSAVFLGERLQARNLLALALGAAGVLLLLLPGLQAYANAPFGFAAGILAGLGWAGGTVMLKRHPIPVPAIVSTGWQLLLSSVPVGVLAVALHAGPVFLPSTLTVVVVSYITMVPMAVGNLWWFSIAGQLPANVAGLSVIMVPVVAMISGALMRGEPLGPPQVAAMACCMGALALTILKPKPASAG